MLTRFRCLALLALLIALPASPQAQQVPGPAPTPAGGVRLFLDCSDFYCESDFYRTEINFVDHVRSREDAHLHLLITSQRTGGGGAEYTLHFLGQRAYAGKADTLRYVSAATATEDETRRGLVRVIKLGLVPYLVNTPAAERLEVSYASPRAGAEPAQSTRDPWDHWTFRTRVGGFFNGESSYESMNLNGSASANRTTERWKTSVSLSSYYSRSIFDLGNGRQASRHQRNHDLSSQVVRSLGSHLSAGIRASANHSTYLNRDLALRIAPAVEYNVFPYSESTRRQFTFQYSLGANQVGYEEETLYGKTNESLVDQTLITSYEVKQRWGTISTSLEGSQYLHDFEKYRLLARSDLDIRLFKGLSFNLWGQAERVRDQLFIPKGRLTEEQIILRQRQLETSFRYFGSLGLSYSFGSIFNNVVNPRFNSGRGGMMIFQ